MFGVNDALCVLGHLSEKKPMPLGVGPKLQEAHSRAIQLVEEEKKVLFDTKTEKKSWTNPWSFFFNL